MSARQLFRPVLPILAATLCCGSMGALSAPSKVGPVPEAIREKLKLDGFYQKYIGVGDLPVLGSSHVTDHALLEAQHILSNVTRGRDDLLKALGEQGARIVIMAHNEYTTDLPEQRDMKPKVYWDRRARGLGGAVCSGAEENLLCYRGDPYWQENILIHEFAHVLHGVALRHVDPEFDGKLKAAYESAMAKGLWKGTYAAVDRGEYWAEGVQDWFDNNRSNDALHNHVHTRAQLKEYDPELAGLCAAVLGDHPWRYLKPMNRPAADRAHLAGFDASRAPRFRWRDDPIPDKPRVVFETAQGDFEVELDSRAAPNTVSNFLQYVDRRLYNDGRFFRTVKLDNQPTNQVRIQALQGEASLVRSNEFLPSIALERTRDTGLRHRDGTLSMARAEPDSAQHSFFICIGDQPELDWGGRRNSDGQGFAAFGRVTRGMDLVRKFHAAPSDERQQLTPPIDIQRAVRLN